MLEGEVEAEDADEAQRPFERVLLVPLGLEVWDIRVPVGQCFDSV